MQKSIKYPKARNHYENDVWQSPVIGRDTPGVKEIFAYLIHYNGLIYVNWHLQRQVLGGRSTSAWVGDKPPSMDNDSAFQEPDLVTSIKGNEQCLILYNTKNLLN